MESIKTQKKGLTFSQIYYQDVAQMEKGAVEGDLLIAYQSPALPHSGIYKKFRTLHVDLSQSKEEILSQFVKNTRYEIRRAAEKDELTLTITTTPDFQFITDFNDFHHQFSLQKGLSPGDPSFLHTLHQQGWLSLSVIKNKAGEPLVFHAHIVCNGRARLFKSASNYRGGDPKERALMGRANRYLQAEEIWYFKKRGLAIYDFGGISFDEQNSDLRGIDQFKMGFGGKIVEEFHCLLPISFLGKLAFFYLKRKWQ